MAAGLPRDLTLERHRTVVSPAPEHPTERKSNALLQITRLDLVTDRVLLGPFSYLTYLSLIFSHERSWLG